VAGVGPSAGTATASGAEAPPRAPAPPVAEPFSVIGKRNRKVEGRRKVTGQTLYTDDLRPPRMLHAKLLRSPHAHARIRAIDATRALGHEGVRAVVTGRDLAVPYGIIPWTRDEYPLALEKALFVGDAVAAVAAEDELTAVEALALVRVDYEVLPSVLSVEDALAHPENQVNPFAKRGNVSKHVRLAFGDVEGALAGADVAVEDTWYYAGSTHAPIEPHCAIGDFGPDGLLTVYSSTQVPHYLHRELARVLDLSADRIRVVQPAVGGAFGGKSEPFDLEFAVAKLSMMTGRPVKILYAREEVFYAHRGRHPMLMTYRLGAKRDGTLTGVRARIHIDGGAYSSFGLVTTYYSGQLLCAPYRMPAYEFDSTRVFTNKPACGPKRGHGSVQPRFAFECALDMLAEKLELDPIELRRRNLLGANERTVNELRVTSNGFPQCLDAVERASGWREKFRRLPYGRGVGVAGSTYISGTNYPIYPNEMPQSGVQVKVDRSGRVTIFSGVSDIGQGCDSVLAYIAAEELGVELESVRVVAADTDLTPVDLGAYSSRITFMAGNAALAACRTLKRRVQEALGARWGVEPQSVGLAGGFATSRQDPSRLAGIAEAFQEAEARFGTLGATGSYNTRKDVHGSYRGGTIGASPAYSFTAHVAEVEVDEETGVVTVPKIWIAHDCGRALNPTLVEGQMEGSAYMGYAEALLEEQEYDPNGLHRGPSLLDYRIPTTLDTPDMESLIVESLDEEGPYGAKEAGEGPLHPSIPAIANAIHDAVGVRLTRLPFRPERVLAAIAERRAAGRSWRGHA
jgi:4-hydroxybenzoyl-CoA reductase alpha subunit